MKNTMDDYLVKIVKRLPQLSPATFDVKAQLDVLIIIANKLGLYEASEILTELTKREKKVLGPQPRKVYY